jgi:hypothetical protein
LISSWISFWFVSAGKQRGIQMYVACSGTWRRYSICFWLNATSAGWGQNSQHT